MEVQKVVTRLRPKMESFGLKAEELQGFAAEIAKDLTSEDTTDESIDAHIDAVLPYLQFAQKYSNRIIEDSRKKAQPAKKTEPADETDDDDSGKKSKKKDDEMPAWFKTYQEAQDKRFETLEKAKFTETYAKKMTERFKDIDPEFYAIAAEGKSFDSDEEFDAFAKKIEDGWTTYSQKLANEGLSRMAKPKGKTENPEDEFVAQMKEINKLKE